MSGALPPLNAPGPLLWMAQALQLRLQSVFPPNVFSFAWMPARADKEWFGRTIVKTPAIAVGWNGTKGLREEGAVFEGEASFSVAIFVKNQSGPQALYLGDAQAPGLFAVARAATIALHGYLIDPDGTSWSATGTVIVNGVGNLHNDDWGNRDIGVCALDLAVRYEEVLPPGMEMPPSNATLIDQVAWDFGEQAPLLQDQFGVGN